MPNKNSQHILNTSSNLLGFCLVVLTSLKISKFNEGSIIDELTGVACILLMGSTLFSFLSIRSKTDKFIVRYEQTADYIFTGALFLVFVVTFLISFSIIF